MCFGFAKSSAEKEIYLSLKSLDFRFLAIRLCAMKIITTTMILSIWLVKKVITDSFCFFRVRYFIPNLLNNLILTLKNKIDSHKSNESCANLLFLPYKTRL